MADVLDYETNQEQCKACDDDATECERYITAGCSHSGYDWANECKA